MKRQTQTILYHLLPAVIWLLAIGGSLAFLLLSSYLPGGVDTRLMTGIPAVLSLLSVFLIAHIKRHTGSVEQCFQVALFLGVASYWLPTVVFLILPIWGWLIFQQQFSFRSFLSTLIGLSVVAVWAGIFICLGWMDNPWAEFFAPKNAWGWIPTGAFIVAFIASTIVRRTLRVR